AAEPWSAPRWIAYCRPWRLCRDPACPRCNYFLRVAAVQYEFGGMFQKARENGLHVVGLVPSFTFDASAGGLHFVLRKLPNGKPKDFRNERPFHGRYDTILLRGDEDPELIQTLRDLLKVLPRLLREVGLVEGAFWQPEFKMSFHPVV